MGCLSLRFWRRKKAAGQSPYGNDLAPRPYAHNYAGAAARHQHHHHHHHQQRVPYPSRPAAAAAAAAAAAGPGAGATYDEKSRYPLRTGPFPAVGGGGGDGGLDDKSPLSLAASSPQDPVGAGIKEKDEGLSPVDADEARRRKAAHEARLKAEREEQERLDFFQMM